MERKYLFVAAIDFGTSRTGFAYASLTGEKRPIYVHEMDRSHLFKTRTDLVLDSDYGVVSFGERAFDVYSTREEEKKWHFLSQFKMSLFSESELKLRPLITTADGKSQISSTLVFQRALEHLTELILATISKNSQAEVTKSDILWVLSVPAIWSQGAKRIMRDAARAARMFDSEGQLILALEPEAAALCCRIEESSRNPQAFLPGSQYIVLDCGGGTIDVVGHEIMKNGDLTEILPPSGGAWGSTYVDENWINTLATILGKDLMSSIQAFSPEAMVDIRRNFERIKVVASDSKKSLPQVTVKIGLPVQLALQKKGKSIESVLGEYKGPYEVKWQSRTGDLQVSMQAVLDCFKPVIEKIVEHTQGCLKKLPKCKVIFLVGGFAESDLLFDAIKDACPGVIVLRPPHASAAVMRGAVEFGRAPSIVSARIMRNTIGISISKPYTEADSKADRPSYLLTQEGVEILHCDVFDPWVRIGQSVNYGEVTEFVYTPGRDNQEAATVIVYSSRKKKPKYTDSCEQLGSLRVSMPIQEGGLSRRIKVRFRFGATEIMVNVVDETSGQEVHGFLDFFQSKKKK